MQMCCYYWAHNCDVSVEQFEKRFRFKKNHIEILKNSNILKEKEGKIHINFLDFQLKDIEKDKKFFSDMGKKGQKAKKEKAPLKSAEKPPSSNKDKEKDNDKDKEKDNIKRTKHIFSNSPFYEHSKWTLAFEGSGWNKTKVDHYYYAAKDYSEANPGKKYASWVAAVRNWDRMKPFREEW